MKKSSLYIVIIAIILVFSMKVSSANAWFFLKEAPDCVDENKPCFKFIEHNALGLSSVGWWGFGTSSLYFNDATSTALQGHHVIPFVSAFPYAISYNNVYGCQPSRDNPTRTCDDPYVYREVSLFQLSRAGFSRIAFVADVTGNCWANRLTWDIMDCYNDGGVKVADFDIRNGQFVANAFLADNSSDIVYLDLVSENDDFEIIYEGFSPYVYTTFSLALGGALISILIYGVIKYKA